MNRYEIIRMVKLELAGIKVNETKMAEGGLENACWDGYEPIGLKDDGSPNCVPIKAKKEKFVIPTPNGGEDEQTFISRCISDIAAEYDAEGQAYAVCKAKYDE